MQVGFGGVNVAPAVASVLNSEQTPRRVAGQQTERPVTETSEAEPRAREEVERSEGRGREVSARPAEDDGRTEEAGARDDPGRRVDISV